MKKSINYGVLIVLVIAVVSAGFYATRENPSLSPAVECSDGLTLCNGRCVDLKSDPDNCGSCGRYCANTQYCRLDEKTGITGCQWCEGTFDENGNFRDDVRIARCGNTCIDVTRDNNNCGYCGFKCKSDEVCVPNPDERLFASPAICKKTDVKSSGLSGNA